MKIDGKLGEERAVFGVSLTTGEAAGITYNGLLSLQHRGQEGATKSVREVRGILLHSLFYRERRIRARKKKIFLSEGTNDVKQSIFNFGKRDGF